jgi:hypothetical protein
MSVLAVGASFDFAGAKPRAHAWLQSLGLEFFFGLCFEPGGCGGAIVWVISPSSPRSTDRLARFDRLDSMPKANPIHSRSGDTGTEICR